jgi:aryl-alcohol dehydrogenase
VLAAVVREKRAPFLFEELDMEVRPRANEVLVRVIATGICQTDVHIRNQEYPVPLPVVLGHEGAGIVEQVGDGIVTVQPGDHVALSYQACPAQVAEPAIIHTVTMVMKPISAEPVWMARMH